MRNRTLARQKARNDNKARIKQMQLERHKMAKQQPVAAPQIEERNFTAAEMELFNGKYAVYQKAANEVNELLAFLKKQHGIRDGEGWQLGQRGFVRPVKAVPSVTEKPKRSRPARLKAGMEGVVEHVEQPHENGVPVSDPIL